MAHDCLQHSDLEDHWCVTRGSSHGFAEQEAFPGVLEAGEMTTASTTKEK